MTFMAFFLVFSAVNESLTGTKELELAQEGQGPLKYSKEATCFLDYKGDIAAFLPCSGFLSGEG